MINYVFACAILLLIGCHKPEKKRVFVFTKQGYYVVKKNGVSSTFLVTPAGDPNRY